MPNIDTFIIDFKQSSYYKQLILNKNNLNNILGIYIVGSTCMKLDDQDSDYDILIITLDGEYIDVSKELILKYKGKKIHWYYSPLGDLFDLHYNDLHLAAPIQLRYLNSTFTIYENSKYKKLLHNIFLHKYEISKLAIYKLFEVHQTMINKVLEQKTILPEQYYYKYFYHLCNSVYYLYNEKPDIEFLKELKRIYCKPISEEVKALAVTCLAKGIKYISEHPIDYKTELLKLKTKII